MPDWDHFGSFCPDKRQRLIPHHPILNHFVSHDNHAATANAVTTMHKSHLACFSLVVNKVHLFA
jgi:hypothetical protein